MKNVIKIKELSFQYGEQKILNNLSLEIKEGEFIGITGKNGSGKSTLMKIIANLEEPSNGIVEVEGKLSMVLQNPNNQIIGTKVIDDIVFGLENYGVSRELMIKQIDEIVKIFDIEDLLERHPQELSGGQKQTVAIAGALILKPKIIIFDEITSMLDNVSKKLVYNQLLKLVKTHTILMITHDSRELLETDRIILLDKGEIKEDLTPNELFKNNELLNKYKLEKPFKVELLEEIKKRGYKKIGDINAN